jgi:hypothetical protein
VVLIVQFTRVHFSSSVRFEKSGVAATAAASVAICVLSPTAPTRTYCMSELVVPGAIVRFWTKPRSFDRLPVGT